jgi:hypothetical protein
MPILVVCPGCKKRFQVSDQFAGKTGPCPTCKTVIKIPTAKEQVVVHEPTAFESGGRSTTGQLVIKPIEHENVRFRPVVAAMIAAVVLFVFVVAFSGRNLIRNSSFGYPLCALGLLLISPPLVVAGYSVLRNDEMEPYRGRPLAIRSTIAAIVYAILWGLFGYVATLVADTEPWTWLVVVPPFFVAGALAALATLDFDFGTGTVHFGGYVLLTILLRWAAGLGWIWHITG